MSRENGRDSHSENSGRVATVNSTNIQLPTASSASFRDDQAAAAEGDCLLSGQAFPFHGQDPFDDAGGQSWFGGVFTAEVLEVALATPQS